MIKKYWMMLITACLLLNVAVGQQQQQVRTLIVFFDGLRPDYITPEQMPNLYAFKKKGGYGKSHHSVFPTVTRVNSASYSTGSYPVTHGLMGNSVFFPEVSANKSLNTGEAEDLMKISEATQGKLLTTISLGEIMQSIGKRMMVFSSGSTGQAYLQNHTISGGAIINPAMILPETLKDSIYKDLGPVGPGGGKHKWVTDALIRYGFATDGPLISAIWFSDPDGTAHAKGIGSPEAVASIKMVDEQFGRIVNTLEEKGLTASYNILISTDHGFMTHVGQGKKSLNAILIENGFKQSETSEDIVTAGGAIYLKDHNPETIKKIVAILQPMDFVGAIFTKAAKPGSTQGFVQGTLSFETIHWNHARAADILVDANWDDRVNSAGYAGASYLPGVAGHGTLSPWDVHIPLIVSGPAFKNAVETELPTSNVDIAPTVLHILNIPVPKAMNGRVINELLRKPAANAIKTVKKETIQTTTAYQGGTYKVTLTRSVLGHYQYVDGARTERK